MMKSTGRLGRSESRPSDNSFESMVYNHANGRAEPFRKEFQLLDFGGTGMLSEARFRAALRNTGFSAPGHLIQKAIKMTANYKANAIDYERFIEICGLRDNAVTDKQRGDPKSLASSKRAEPSASERQTPGSPSQRTSKSTTGYESSEVFEMPDQYLSTSRQAMHTTAMNESKLDTTNAAGVRSIKKSSSPQRKSTTAPAPLLTSAMSQAAQNKQEMESSYVQRTERTERTECGEKPTTAQSLSPNSPKSSLKLSGNVGIAQKILADHMTTRGNIAKTFRTRFDLKGQGQIDRKDFIFGLRYSGLSSDLISDHESLALFDAVTKHSNTDRMTINDFERLLTRTENMDTMLCFNVTSSPGSRDKIGFIGDDRRGVAARVNKATTDTEVDIGKMRHYPEELDRIINQYKSEVGVGNNLDASTKLPPRLTHDTKDAKDATNMSNNLGTSEKSLKMSSLDGTNVSQYDGSSYKESETTNQSLCRTHSTEDSILAETLKRKIQTAIEEKYASRQAAVVAASSPSKSVSDASVFQFLHKLLPDATDHQIKLVMDHVKSSDESSKSAHTHQQTMQKPPAAQLMHVSRLEHSARGAQPDLLKPATNIETVSRKRSASASNINTYADLFAPPDDECSRKRRMDDAVWARVVESNAAENRAVGAITPLEAQRKCFESKNHTCDNISLIMDPKANIHYRDPSYTGMSTVNSARKQDSSELMGAITTEGKELAQAERPPTRRAKSAAEARNKYNSETLEATKGKPHDKTSETPRGFQNIKRSLLEGMHGKKVALAECLVTAANKSKDAYDFKMFISDFTDNRLDKRQLDTLVRCSIDPSTQKISTERVLRNLNLTTEGLYHLPSVSHASGEESDGMVLQTIYREQLVKFKEKKARPAPSSSVLQGTVLASYINNDVMSPDALEGPEIVDLQGKYKRFVNYSDATSSRYENSVDPNDTARTARQEQVTKSSLMCCYEDVPVESIIKHRSPETAMPSLNSQGVRQAMTTISGDQYGEVLDQASEELCTRLGTRSRPTSTRVRTDSSAGSIHTVFSGFSGKYADDPVMRPNRRHSNIRQQASDLFRGSDDGSHSLCNSGRRHFSGNQGNSSANISMIMSQVESP